MILAPLRFVSILGFASSLVSVAQAGQCTRTAVRVARENSRGASILQEIEHIKTRKAYLESYGVTFINYVGDPASVTSFVVTMMKSDCTVASIVRR